MEKIFLTIVKKKEKEETLIENTAKQTQPVLCDPDVKSYLEALHKCFIIVTIDKAANYYAFIRNKYNMNREL